MIRIIQMSSPRPRPACSALAASRDRVSYIGCGGPLLLTAAGNLNGTLIPDAVIPSPAGYDLLFSQCFMQAIQGLLPAP